MAQHDRSGEAGNEGVIHRRQIDPDPEGANERLIRVIAELENCDPTDLPPFYTKIDDLVENLFGDPPPDDAQVQIEFSYHGYRVDVDQTGNVSLMKLTDEPLAEE